MSLRFFSRFFFGFLVFGVFVFFSFLRFYSSCKFFGFCLIFSFNFQSLQSTLELTIRNTIKFPLHLLHLNQKQSRKYVNEWKNHPNKIIRNHLAPVRYIKTNKMTFLQKKNITLITFNVNGSFLNQIGQTNPINCIINDKKPDIIGIIDTRHNNNTYIPNFHNYNMIHIENSVKTLEELLFTIK